MNVTLVSIGLILGASVGAAADNVPVGVILGALFGMAADHFRKKKK